MTLRNLPDRLLALVLFPFVSVLIGLLFLAIYPIQRGPFFYRSERMRTPDQSFTLYKIRTMHPPSVFDGERILGGDQSDRVTRIGGILRRTRLDELPQILNILRGDLVFIGPRPPLRKYVEAFPESYARVLSMRPGVTGLATVMVCRREERVLSRSHSPEETDRLYRAHCIPWKVRIDLFHQSRRTPALAAYVLFRTLFRGHVKEARVLRRWIAGLSMPRTGLRRPYSFRRRAET